MTLPSVEIGSGQYRPYSLCRVPAISVARGGHVAGALAPPGTRRGAARRQGLAQLEGLTRILGKTTRDAVRNKER